LTTLDIRWICGIVAHDWTLAKELVSMVPVWHCTIFEPSHIRRLPHTNGIKCFWQPDLVFAEAHHARIAKVESDVQLQTLTLVKCSRELQAGR